MENIIKIGLAESTYNLPVTDGLVTDCLYQEGDITLPLDVKKLAQIADKRLRELGAVSSFEDRFNPSHINLYVRARYWSGSTAAMAAVIRVALTKGYLLTIHYLNTTTNDWIPQTIVGKSDLHLDSDYPSLIMGGVL